MANVMWPIPLQPLFSGRNTVYDSTNGVAERIAGEYYARFVYRG